MHDVDFKVKVSAIYSVLRRRVEVKLGDLVFVCLGTKMLYSYLRAEVVSRDFIRMDLHLHGVFGPGQMEVFSEVFILLNQLIVILWDRNTVAPAVGPTGF